MATTKIAPTFTIGVECAALAHLEHDIVHIATISNHLPDNNPSERLYRDGYAFYVEAVTKASRLIEQRNLR